MRLVRRAKCVHVFHVEHFVLPVVYVYLYTYNAFYPKIHKELGDSGLTAAGEASSSYLGAMTSGHTEL